MQELMILVTEMIKEAAPTKEGSELEQILGAAILQPRAAKGTSRPKVVSASVSANLQGKFPVCPKCKG